MKKKLWIHYPRYDLTTAWCGIAFVKFSGTDADFDRSKDCPKCLAEIRKARS